MRTDKSTHLKSRPRRKVVKSPLYKPPLTAEALASELENEKKVATLGIEVVKPHPVFSISRAANVPNRAARRSGQINSASKKRIAEFGKVRKADQP